MAPLGPGVPEPRSPAYICCVSRSRSAWSASGFCQGPWGAGRGVAVGTGAGAVGMVETDAIPSLRSPPLPQSTAARP
jgi:hypothetical protein